MCITAATRATRASARINVTIKHNAPSTICITAARRMVRVIALIITQSSTMTSANNAESVSPAASFENSEARLASFSDFSNKILYLSAIARTGIQIAFASSPVPAHAENGRNIPKITAARIPNVIKIERIPFSAPAR